MRHSWYCNCNKSSFYFYWCTDAKMIHEVSHSISYIRPHLQCHLQERLIWTTSFIEPMVDQSLSTFQYLLQTLRGALTSCKDIYDYKILLQLTLTSATLGHYLCQSKYGMDFQNQHHKWKFKYLKFSFAHQSEKYNTSLARPAMDVCYWSQPDFEINVIVMSNKE